MWAGQGRTVRVVSRSRLSWALCGDNQLTELFKVALNLCALATWPWKGFGRRKVVRQGLCWQHWGKGSLLSQPSVGSARSRTLWVWFCLARVQLVWCRGEAIDIPARHHQNSCLNFRGTQENTPRSRGPLSCSGQKQ